MPDPSRPKAGAQPGSPAAAIGWALYDWANSAYAAVIGTFVFSAYFASAVAPDVVHGTAWWGYAVSASGVLVAFTAPLFGAIIDRTGRRKRWLGTATLALVLATASLWFVRPEAAWVAYTLVAVAIANYAFELGTVFYNAMLPDVAGAGRTGRVSGWGWGLGYLGGLACLGVMFVGFLETDRPWFGLDPAAAEPVRAAGPLVALWLAVFALPLFVLVPERPANPIGVRRAVREGLAKLAETLRHLRGQRDLTRYLVAHMIYIDGLNTVFTFGGIYAAGTFGMTLAEIAAFGIALSVAAGVGAIAFAWVDDWLGPKRTVMLSLGCLLVAASLLVVVEDRLWFWIAALPLGLFVGPVQSASRSLLAHLAPPERRTELFGFFALSGKITTFAGPAVVAVVTDLASSQRAGMASVLAFFAVGLWMLRRTPDARGR